MTDATEIPVSIPDLSGNEERYVVEAIRSSWISSTGSFISRFEREFASSCDARSAVTVSNGTVALHLGLVALGLQPGDEVIVPSLTYVATANAVHYAGGVPVFADVEPGTWCLDVKSVQELISPRTKGIIAVHLYGHPADMDALSAVAAKNGIWLLEDAAEAHFATYKGRPVGGLSTVAMFSFYGNKILTSGEGGALVVNDMDLERRIRLFRGQGMDPERRYYFPVIGYNYRLTNVAAAMLCAQLERREAIVERRRQVFRWYAERLSAFPEIDLQPVAPWAVPAPWLYSVVVSKDFGRTRDEVMEGLKEFGVDSRPFFFPVHRLPPYEVAQKAAKADLPVTEKLAAGGLNLPTYPGLTEQEVERVCSSLIRMRR